MEIRFINDNDIPALLGIYAQYINTPVTCEYVLPSIQEFLERVKEISSEYPYLVCQKDGKIIGYAYAHRQMERAAYNWNAELSVYIDTAFVSKGLGKRLYNILIEILKLQGIKNVYGGVVLPNTKSEQLHKSLGFEICALYKNTAYKDNKWHNIIWYEKQIAPYENNPDFILPINKIPMNTIQSIIQKFS